MLRLVANVSRSLRRHTCRSVGAMLRAEMVHRKQQNKHLQQELENLRQKLSDVRVQSMIAGTPQTYKPFGTYVGNNDVVLPQNKLVPACDAKGPGGLVDFAEETSVINRKSDELDREARHQAAVEEEYHVFQAKERDTHNKKRAMVLERKRRLLEQDPDVLQPADDEHALEDGATTQVQRIVRGAQARARVRKLRPLLSNAATMIQGIMRGHLGRSYADLKRLDKHAVIYIQRVWRGHVGRCTLKSTRWKLERTVAARDIQRIARGREGRRRVEHKRSLRESARRGSEVVGAKQLFHQDIVELANAVDARTSKRAAPPLPNIVLGLLKVVSLMLEEDEESGAITQYSVLGVQSVKKVKAALLFSWQDALCLLRRSSKLLRRLRQVAEGPACRRPRMIYFSQDAIETYRALQCDDGWNVNTIGCVGGGAKACQHLMMWVDALQEVFAYQREFADDLGSDRMPWVARVHESMRCMRHLELSRMVWENAVTCLQQILHESRAELPKHRQSGLPANVSSRRGDLRLCVAEGALKILEERHACARDVLMRMKQEEDEAQRNDEARERLRMAALVEDLTHAEASLADICIRLEAARKTARNEIQTDQAHLQLCLDELTTCEIVRRERWTSLEMFRTQKMRNDKRRGTDVEVWGDLRHQLRVVGELEAASAIAAEDLKIILNGSEPDVGAVSASFSIQELEVLQTKAKEAQSFAAAAQMRLDFMEQEKENAHTVASEAEVSFNFDA